MNREQVHEAVTEYLRSEFGKLLIVRDVRRVRRVTYVGWAVHVVARLAPGDVHIAELEVDESGVLSPLLDPEGVVEMLRRGEPADASSLAAGAPSEEQLSSDRSTPELEDFGSDVGTLPEADAAEPASTEGLDWDDHEPLEARIRAQIAKGDEASLRRVRSLYPRLLSDAETRGTTLMGMADVERKLGQNKLALDYVEAAAREFADRFDVEQLEHAAAMGLDILGKDAFSGSRVHTLLERSRSRLRPLVDVIDAPSLQGVTPEQRLWLEMNAELRTLAPGEILVREGDPSLAVFVIKSGILAVLLENSEGRARVVRCCFPGWLLGESSVLIANDPRCTATLRAERVTEVWSLEAALLASVMEKNPALRDRVAAAKQFHRIDSFFAMHETMGQLDALVRDEMLGCILRIQSFEADTLLAPSGEVPKSAMLVARGEITLHPGWDLDSEPVATLGADNFVSVRDALHEIPATCTAVARAGSTVAFFDAKKLRALAQRSPEHVAAVLERLG